MPTCWHCQAETPTAHYERIVHNHTKLYGPWDGWRMAGRFLIAPGPAGRITPERLLGMLWEERARRSRVARVEQSQLTPARIVPILPARERFDGQA